MCNLTKGMVVAVFDTIKIEHIGDGSGYRVAVDGKVYFCADTVELVRFLEGIGA